MAAKQTQRYAELRETQILLMHRKHRISNADASSSLSSIMNRFKTLAKFYPSTLSSGATTLFFSFKMRLLSPSGVFLEYRQVWLVGLVCLMIAALALVIIAKQKEIILLLKDHATLKRNLTP